MGLIHAVAEDQGPRGNAGKIRPERKRGSAVTPRTTGALNFRRERWEL